MDYYDLYDIITSLRLQASEDDLNVEEVLDLLEEEVKKLEYDDFGGTES